MKCLHCLQEVATGSRCPRCEARYREILADLERTDTEELEAAGRAVDSLQAGTFYEEEDAACREIFRHGVKYID